MKKDEIIELLKEQLRVANDTVGSLTTQVNELIERIKSLEELLVQKGIAIDKVNRQNKALGKLVSGKKSERQEKNPQASMTQEEFDKKKTEQAEKRKARKNNGAKRDMHYEMKEVHVTILARSVLPVPGAPVRITPLGILAPREVYLTGSLRKSTISSSSSFSS